ncbi:Fibrinogen-like protein A [Holothuria leucospilota]|uniref:Fibrinogen-like protein A n=1 Tax=Holothuria leucospilota TaxID=206669 RepID=A0A9Q0YQ28_HOLLE|nr:Fibrinogen-like protein A [Holothuria leucospilota]
MIFMMKFLVVFGFVLGLCTSDIVASVSSELRQDEINFRARRSTDSSSYFFYQQTEYPRDCREVYDQCEDQSADGVYLIQPEGSPEPFKVYCNNSIDGGGWTIFQRRIDGSVDFYRSWVEYKDGFGFLRGEFWLGNDKISYLTNQKTYELRVDLNNVNGQPFFFKYNIFRISDEGSKYRLVGLGGYTSSSGLSRTHKKVQFKQTWDFNCGGPQSPNPGGATAHGSSYFFYQQPEYPRDCKEVYDQCEDQSADGVYLIKPESSPEPFEVYCNNSIDGGGWTLFQRRIDGSVDFYRTWIEYKNGFGFLRSEFWLGNDKISQLTNQKTYELRVDLNNVHGEPFFFKYNLFRISDEGSKYRLVGLGDYTSSSGLSSYNNMGSENRNQSFSTRDQDNDRDVRYNCATYHHSAWWFPFNSPNDYCSHESNLNGLYNAGSTYHKSIQWYNLPGSRFNIKYTEMKIRPRTDP